MQIVGASLLALGVLLAFSGVNIGLGIALMIAGGVSLLAGTAVLNWDAIREKLADVWDSIKKWWSKNCAEYFTKEHWLGVGRSIINGFLDGLKSAWESVTSWVSSSVNWVKKTLSGAFSAIKSAGSAAGSMWGGSSKTSTQSALANAFRSVNIPQLAQGAVIPPNRQFLAVLGDQKSGTNVEAPLETIVQAFRQAIAENGGSGRPVYLMLDRRELGRAVLEVGDQESIRVGVSLT